MVTSDPLTNIAFSLHENKGVFAVLIGSGLSRSSSIPTGWEITLDLVRRISAAQGALDQDDWAAWYRVTTGTEPNYSHLLHEVAESPSERRSILHSYIEPTAEDREEGRRMPTEAHKAIARLVLSGHVRVIITTNFDRLMENALRELGVEPTVIASVDALAGAEPLTHSKCFLVKLHGDYKDARILNTEQELDVYPAQYNLLLDRIFDEHGLIVCGWSGEWDHALRAAFLRAPNRRYPIFWAHRDALGSGAEELVKTRSAKLVQIESADKFFATVGERVETLDEMRKQNPDSTDVLVASVKRYAGSRDNRIKLEDTISSEVERLIHGLNGSGFNSNDAWTSAEFARKVTAYESLSERLGRVVGLLGRWGDGQEVSLIVDVIRTLYSHAETQRNGLAPYLSLRSYPCVLLLTMYGVGLTKAQRWGDFHKVFSVTLPSENDSSYSIVARLLLWSWEGGKDEYWKQLPELDRRHTPLSDHLFGLVKSWKSSFAAVESDVDLLYERYESLAALVFFEQYDEAKMEAASKSMTAQTGPMGWMPVGRIAYRRSDRTKFCEELSREETIDALLKAGFAKNSRRFLALFVQNLNFISGRISFS